MKDYYNLFVELSLQQCTQNDYSDKKKVKAHNAASKKLRELQEEMKGCDIAATLEMLLSHEDERVRVNAAALCLEMKVLFEKAVLTLKNVINSSGDPTILFSAKMILQNISR